MVNVKILEAPIVEFVKAHTDVNINDFNTILKAHPEYPSFSSIFFSLDFFSIEFDLYETSILDVDENLNSFFAILTENDGLYYISSIVKKNNIFFADKHKISYDDLSKVWTNNIIVIQKKKLPFSSLKHYKLSILFILVCLLGWFISDSRNIPTNILISLSSFGLILSFLSLNLELNFFSISDSFCNVGKKWDCKSIVNSKKMKFLNLIKFSDISISFFLTQLLFLFIIPINTSFLNLNLGIVLLSFPFVLFSFYYQLFVEKKFCLFCTLLSLVLIFEFFLLYFSENDFYFSLRFILKHLILQGFFLFIISSFRDLIIETNKKNEKLLFKKRYLNKYEVFIKNLTNQKKCKVVSDLLFYDEKKINFTIITDPFCLHCNKAHEDLISILSKIDDNLYNLGIVFNIDINDENSEDLLLYSSMINLQMTNKKLFLERLTFWFKNNDVKSWNKNYAQDIDNYEFAQDFLIRQHNWCNSNAIDKTPILLINGYIFPDCYDIIDLNYVINQLVDERF